MPVRRSTTLVRDALLRHRIEGHPHSHRHDLSHTSVGAAGGTGCNVDPQSPKRAAADLGPP
jgi:hypothetical protein